MVDVYKLEDNFSQDVAKTVKALEALDARVKRAEVAALAVALIPAVPGAPAFGLTAGLAGSLRQRIKDRVPPEFGARRFPVPGKRGKQAIRKRLPG